MLFIGGVFEALKYMCKKTQRYGQVFWIRPNAEPRRTVSQRTDCKIAFQFKWGKNAKDINESLDSRYIEKVLVTQVSGGIQDNERGFNTIKQVIPIGSTQLIKFNDITDYGMPQHARFIR